MQLHEFFQTLRDIRAGEKRGRSSARSRQPVGNPPVKTLSPLSGTKQRWSTHGISFHRTRDEAIRKDITGDAQRGLVQPRLVRLRGGEVVA